MPPSACLDECMHLGLIDALSARGFSVTSLQIVGPRGADDDTVLTRVTELGCLLITHNTDDFKIVHADFQRRGQPHGGIVCLPQARSFSRLELRAAMMLDWLAGQPYASRLFIWGDLQRLFERGLRLPGYTEPDVRHVLGAL
ncbi:MAG: hypothetical protein EPO26_08095 [Chloroflexota bacterium]|nr:MAG: hypothetical protein EPO26_08095 [Chloroflexota bacterium]